MGKQNMANFKLKNIFIIFSFLFIFILTPNINAAETESEAKNTHITTEEATVDLMNRFILGFFGKDALQSFEAKHISDLEDINNANDLAALSSPFPYLYTKTQFIFYAIYTLSFLSFTFYLLFLMYFGILKSQNSGSFLGQSWNTVYTVLKIFIALLLITPVAGYESLVDDNDKVIDNPLSNFPQLNNNVYSTSQMIAFKMAGYSNFYGRQINDAIIDNQVGMYPSLLMPKSDSKMLEIKDLLDFMVCSKTNIDATENIEFQLIEKESVVFIHAKNGECMLNFEMGIDLKGTKIVEENSFLQTIVPNFKETQKEIIKELFKELIKNADKIADVIVNQTKNYSDDDTSRFEDYLKGGSLSDTATYWESNCDTIFDYPVDSSSPLNKIEVSQYAFMGLRCLSYQINKKIILPDVENINGFLESGSSLNNRVVELCSTDYEFDATAKKIATVVGDSNLVDDLKISDNANSFKFLEPSECVADSCSSLNPTGEFTNLYSCSNAINVYNRAIENKKYKELGVLSITANLFRIFSIDNPTSAKSVYNNLKAEYLSFLGKFLSDTNGSPSETYTISISKANVYEGLADEFQEIDYIDVETTYFKDINMDYFASIYKFLSNGNDSNGIFGANRLVNCIQYPMTIHNGFNCGSVTQEYSNFGRTLLGSAIQYKAMRFILGSSSSKKTSGGNFSKNKDKNIKSSVIKIVAETAKFFGAAFAIDFLLDITTETDEFGGLTSKDLSFMKYSEELVAFIASVAPNGASIKIDFFFNIIGYLGILFAYVIPFYPMFIALGLFFEWFLLFLCVLILIPFCSAYLLKPSENHLNQVFTTSFNILFSLFLKIPFLMVGLILGWILANTVISRIMGVFDFSSVTTTTEFFSIASLINPVVMVVVYGILLYMFTTVALNVMDKFYHFATDWMIKILGDSQLKNTPSGFFRQSKGIADNSKRLQKSNLGKSLSKNFGDKL